MGVNRMLVQSEDGLATLRDLLSVKKEDVIAAHEEVRKQIALTADEQKKADDARAFIAQHAQLKADLDAQQAELDAKDLAFVSKVSEFQDNSLSESARLSDWEKALTQKQKDIDSAIKENAATAKKLEDDRRYMTDSFNSANAKLQTDAVTVERQRQANEAEKARLAGISTELRTKAQKQLDSF